MAQRIPPLRGFFRTKSRPKSFEEARNIYSFFASKGELIEFKFARDPEVKKFKDYGWISYKDNKITEQLFENWFKIEPHNAEVIIERGVKEKLLHQRSGSLPLMFEGFYKSDETLSPDQTNNNFNSKNEDNQGGEDITIKVAEEAIKASENQKEPSPNNSNETIIENTATIIETRIDEAVPQ